MENLDDILFFDTPPKQATRSDWHDKRLGRLTASRFYDVIQSGRGKNDLFGTRCNTYILEKAAEILTGSPHLAGGMAIDWGNDHEEEAIKYYTQVTGRRVKWSDFIPFGDHAGGTPDGLVGEDGGIEIKCPFNPANHVEVIITNQVPEKYYPQVQGSMLITGRKWWDFASYDPRVEGDNRMHIIRVEADPEYHQMLVERLELVSNELERIVIQILKS